MEFIKKFKKSLVGAIALSLLALGVGAYQQNTIGSNLDPGIGNRTLLWVYNAEASTALANGDSVIYYDGTLADGLEVKLCSAGDEKLVAGVAIGAVTAGTFGFIQTHGYHSAIKVTVATTAGDALSTSSTSGKAKVDASAGFDNFAVCLEATTSSTTVKGFIRL